MESEWLPALCVGHDCRLSDGREDPDHFAERIFYSRIAIAYRAVACQFAELVEALGENLCSPAARRCSVEPVFHPA